MSVTQATCTGWHAAWLATWAEAAPIERCVDRRVLIRGNKLIEVCEPPTTCHACAPPRFVVIHPADVRAGDTVRVLELVDGTYREIEGGCRVVEG